VYGACGVFKLCGARNEVACFELIRRRVAIVFYLFCCIIIIIAIVIMILHSLQILNYRILFHTIRNNYAITPAV